MTKKILIFRTDRVGDLIVSCPPILTIKETFPDSDITLVSSKKNYFYAKKLFLFKKILIFPVSGFFKKIKFILELRKKKFDYIYVFDGKEKSFIMAFFIKSTFKVGMSTKIKKYLNLLNIKVFLFKNKKLYEVYQNILDYTKINKKISHYAFIKKKKIIIL